VRLLFPTNKYHGTLLFLERLLVISWYQYRIMLEPMEFSRVEAEVPQNKQNEEDKCVESFIKSEKNIYSRKIPIIFVAYNSVTLTQFGDFYFFFKKKKFEK
jgi:hypothetical protein